MIEIRLRYVATADVLYCTQVRQFLGAFRGVIIVDQKQLFTVFGLIPVKIQLIQEVFLYASTSRLGNVYENAFERLANHVI
jgi:hypothetical protein